MQPSAPCQLSKVQDKFAASLVCVILLVFQFWLRESALHRRFWIILHMRKKKGCFLTGTEDIHIENINVVGEN